MSVIDTSIEDPLNDLSNFLRRTFGTSTIPPNVQKQFKLPTSWHITHLDGDFIAPEIYVAPAKKEKARLVFLSGLNSTPLYFKKEIKLLRKIGVGFMGYALPDTNNAKGDLIQNLRAPIEKILLDPQSPIYQGLNQDTPIYLVTHSTSSLLFTDISTQSVENRDFLEDRISGVEHLAGFYDTATSSRDFNPVKDVIYTAYSSLFRAFRVGSSPLDKTYYWWKNIPLSNQEKSTSYMNACHDEIRILRQYSRSIMDRLITLDSNPDYMPLAIAQTFIIGEDDPIACPDAAKLVATLLAAEILPLDCKHNPLQQQFDAAMGKIINDLRRCAPDLVEADEAINKHYKGSTFTPVPMSI